MSAPREAVQYAYSEGGFGPKVRVGRGLAVRVDPRMIVLGPVHVHVSVLVAVVRVRVGVHLVSHRLPDPPCPDPDQHHADQPFAPPGNPLPREDLAKQKGGYSYDHHTGCVAEPPKQACFPSPFTSVGRERRDGRQVVRPGQDVDGTCGQARDDDLDQEDTELSAAGGGP